MTLSKASRVPVDCFVMSSTLCVCLRPFTLNAELCCVCFLCCALALTPLNLCHLFD
jgi:hypothetical protein